MKPEDVTDKTLGWHKLAVDKLRKHPELLPVVKRNIETFRERVHPSSMHYVLEWDEHYKKGPEHLFSVALEESEHANDLRQCSPFGGILTNQERWGYFREWKRDYEARRSNRPRRLPYTRRRAAA